MLKPDYRGHSIVNLMNSLLADYGMDTYYPRLSDFDLDFTRYENVVFMVFDGLGYHYLMNEPDCFLKKHMLCSLTSVFPTTTASAITSFLTAQAPLQHGLTGWYMYFRELGVCGMPLPFSPRYDSRLSFDRIPVNADAIYDYQNIFKNWPNLYTIIAPEVTIHSAYSNHSFGLKNKIGYKDRADFFSTVSGVLNAVIDLEEKKNTIYAYYPYFDEMAHHYGIGSAKCKEELKMMNESVENLIQNSPEKTLFIFTADHGLADVLPQNKLSLNDYPDIRSSLILPICGEFRTPYCYVRPGKAHRFTEIVREQLGGYCECLTIDEALEQRLFGLGEINPKFYDRVGDFILLMHDGYILTDRVLNERESAHIGYHGGLSLEELLVPLIVVEK